MNSPTQSPTFGAPHSNYIEECDGRMKAYEFKWNPAKKAKVSKTFVNAYPGVEVQTITRENYMDFL